MVTNPVTPTAPGEWCATCSRYVPTAELTDAGNCPTCNTLLREHKAPWHFKLLLAALTIYLAWRFIQIIIWVVHQLH